MRQPAWAPDSRGCGIVARHGQPTACLLHREFVGTRAHFANRIAAYVEIPVHAVNSVRFGLSQVDAAQDVGEQRPRLRHLGHLEHRAGP